VASPAKRDAATGTAHDRNSRPGGAPESSRWQVPRSGTQPPERRSHRIGVASHIVSDRERELAKGRPGGREMRSPARKGRDR
jgi:hypothetical protein